jgi:hypothetical protein
MYYSRLAQISRIPRILKTSAKKICEIREICARDYSIKFGYFNNSK